MKEFRGIGIFGKGIKVLNKMVLICFIEKIIFGYEIEEGEIYLYI